MNAIMARIVTFIDNVQMLAKGRTCTLLTILPCFARVNCNLSSNRGILLNLSKIRVLKLLIGIGLGFLVIVLTLLFLPKVEETKLLYATSGDSYDTAAYSNFQQTLQAGVQIDRKSLLTFSTRQLRSYDALYLDPALAQDPNGPNKRTSSWLS